MPAISRRTVQLQPDEFEVHATVHPYRRTILDKRKEPYYVNSAIFTGSVQSYKLFVNRRGKETPLWLGETDIDVYSDPVRIEKGEDVIVEFNGPMSSEVVFICSPAKREE